MRFKKLTIRNYRGVGAASVDFADSGITLIQGPNEAGKSSLAEAVHILYQYKASTNHADVREIKPVHRDEGPEIELEATSGPYHFVYAKKFLKAKSSTLTVSEPRAENHTGDAAHERAEQILAETLDKDLWDALIVHQGDMIDIPDLSGKAALMRALDAAAGGGGTDAAAETLFERVTAAYQKYYMTNGRENRELSQARQRLEQARERAAALDEQLRDIDAKTERSALLRRERHRTETTLAEKLEKLEEKKSVLQELTSLEQAAGEARLRLEAAEARARTAQAAWRARRRLLEAVEAARKKRDEIHAPEPSRDDERELADELRRAEEEKRSAEQRRRDAEAALTRARGDCDFLRDRERLDDLRRRSAAVADARAAVRRAEAELADNRVDDATLGKIKAADLAVTRLRSLLRANAPRVALTGLGGATLLVDGSPIAISASEEKDFPVTDALEIEIPGAVRLRIESGRAGDADRDKLERAEAELASLCADAGVGGMEEAITAALRRREAEQALAASRQREEAESSGSKDIEAAIRAAEDAMARYAASRGDGAPPIDLDAASAIRDAAESAFEQTRADMEAALLAVEELRRRRDAAAASGNAARVERDVAEKSLQLAEDEAGAARAEAGDDALEAAATEAEQEAAARRDDAAKAEAALAERNPGRERALAETLEGGIATLRERVRELEREQTALTTELRVRGEEGLHEQLADARIEEEEADAALSALSAKAAAASTLYKTMRTARETARRSYIMPLKEKVEELGRWVFDASFQVEMNEEDLSIATRTMRGVTVPFNSLSGGAREQLSLIFRAACAILVARQEGMPLILDDALGYSDSERLELMGAVLSKAAEQCQIIIFTCMPERYASIGNAKIIQL